MDVLRNFCEGDLYAVVVEFFSRGAAQHSVNRVHLGLHPLVLEAYKVTVEPAPYNGIDILVEGMFLRIRIAGTDLVIQEPEDALVHDNLPELRPLLIEHLYLFSVLGTQEIYGNAHRIPEIFHGGLLWIYLPNQGS